MGLQRLFGNISRHLLKTGNRNWTVSSRNEKCYLTCSFAVNNDIIHFDVKNEQSILDAKMHAIEHFLRVTVNLKM